MQQLNISNVRELEDLLINDCMYSVSPLICNFSRMYILVSPVSDARSVLSSQFYASFQFFCRVLQGILKFFACLTWNLGVWGGVGYCKREARSATPLLWGDFLSLSVTCNAAVCTCAHVLLNVQELVKLKPSETFSPFLFLVNKGLVSCSFFAKSLLCEGKESFMTLLM